jgi:hypothetical protein
MGPRKKARDLRAAAAGQKRQDGGHYIVINCHKKTSVHLLGSGMAHKSLHTVLWRSAVNDARRLVTCFQIVIEELRSYCGTHMRRYGALSAATHWPAQGFAAPIGRFQLFVNDGRMQPGICFASYKCWFDWR